MNDQDLDRLKADLRGLEAYQKMYPGSPVKPVCSNAMAAWLVAEVERLGAANWAYEQAPARWESSIESKVQTLNYHRLQEQHDKLLQFMDGVREAARNRNPQGATILDFMACWNEQYEKRIADLQSEVERLRAQYGPWKLDELKEEIIKSHAEITRLQALNESLAARVAAQSELLSRKAEKPDSDQGPPR